MNLDGRGLLKAGFFADIAILDPGRIIDNATYDEPNKQSAGVEYVLVNGQLAYERGRMQPLLGRNASSLRPASGTI